MMNQRYLPLYLFGLLVLCLTIPAVNAEIIDDDTPVPPVGALGGPDRVLDAAELEQWIRGRKVFDRDWELSEGLGTPDLNADSCRSCHQKPVIGAAGGLDVNVTRFGFDNDGTGPFEDLPGGQVASKGRRPDTPGREDADPMADIFEQRQTPSILGLGLIDTISDAEVLSNEDPNDNDGDGCRGTAHMIDIAGVLEVGKFGWKAQVPTLSDFLRDASTGEVGLTLVDDGRGFGALSDGDNVADPEFSPDEFADMLFYCAHLAYPPRGGNPDPQVAVGEEIFTDIGCAICHIPELQGSEGPVPLYSDLLVHDIHPDDFRGVGEAGAPVGSFKTPPLWGIRDTAPYLHDGRATTIEDAILAHEDEADLMMQNYFALTEAEKEALLLFLSDL
ncbi:MAG: di-heme oxidoredictase family protein [Planctomycetota bacterium]|nr:di-heme oxidoredictase family protein [Planctomycetota bacterium]